MIFFRFFFSILALITFFHQNLNCEFSSGYPYNSMSPRQEEHPFHFYDINPEKFDFNNKYNKELFKTRFNNNLRMTIIIACCLRRMNETNNKKIILTHEERQSGMRIVFEKQVNKLFLVGALDTNLKNYIDTLISLIKKINETDFNIFSNGDLIRHKERMGYIPVPWVSSVIDKSPWEIKEINKLTTKEEKTGFAQGFEKIEYKNIYIKFRICIKNMNTMVELIDKFVDNKIQKLTDIVKPYQGKTKGEIGTYWDKLIRINNKRKKFRDELKPIITNTIEQIKAIEEGMRTGTPPSNPGSPVSPRSPKRTED